MAAALLLVRVYHTSGVSVEDRGGAEREAEAVVGVAMAWVNCPSGPPTAAALVPRCAEAPGPLDIVLRLESASPQAAAEIQRNVASDWVSTRRERDAMVQAVLERLARATARRSWSS